MRALGYETEANGHWDHMLQSKIAKYTPTGLFYKFFMNINAKK
jgi:hypothetical protein